MQPKIQNCERKYLAGLNREMTFAADTTPDLWRNFMQRRKEISNAVDTDLISLQIYKPGYDFSIFEPQMTFQKWACCEVADFNNLPEGMSHLVLEPGKYAVFKHIGGPARAMFSFSYIFGTWLPASGYTIDNRPHFEVMAAKYKHNDPHSEEEIWIPVR
jgi:AraC family transcriptional regulator